MYDTWTLVEVIILLIACTWASIIYPPFGLVMRFLLRVALTLALIAVGCLTLGVLSAPLYGLWRRV